MVVVPHPPSPRFPPDPLCSCFGCRLAQDSLVGDGTAHAHICLGDRQRAFSEQVRQAGEMGFPPDWCALALTEDRGMEAAVAWLLSNYAA